MKLHEKLFKLFKGEEFEERQDLNFDGIENIVIYSDIGKVNILQAKLAKPMIYCFGYRPRTSTIKLDISKRDEKTMTISVYCEERNLEKAETNLTVFIPRLKFKCIEVSGIKTEINIDSAVDAEEVTLKTFEGDIEFLSDGTQNLYVAIQKSGNIYLHLNEDEVESMEAFTENGEIEINFFNKEEGRTIKLVQRK